MKKKYKIITLGCRTNQYESQAFRDQLEAVGYQAVGEGEEADLCIVNTCTVTAAADKESRLQIRQLARSYPTSRIVVTGCAAEKDPEGMVVLEGVAQLVPNKAKEELVASLLPEEEVPPFFIRQFAGHTRAFVKVQDGCNSFCTYCILPYVRGRSRSRSIGEIVQEVEGLVANGYQEVVLTGVNIGDFDGGEIPQRRLAELVRTLDGVEGLKRLRLSSIDPDEVDEELTDALLQGRTTCPSLHLVLQSGSNGVLKRMNRKYTREIFLETMRQLRKRDPDFTFTTDVIVGFPGETERDFLDTLEVMEEVHFAKVHMFPYSRRERTRAALYPGQVDPQVMQERKARLLRAAEEGAWKLRERYVGRTVEVLTERREDASRISGHTANFLEVFLTSSSLERNQLATLRLVANTPAGLEGVVVA